VLKAHASACFPLRRWPFTAPTFSRLQSEQDRGGDARVELAVAGCRGAERTERSSNRIYLLQSRKTYKNGEDQEYNSRSTTTFLDKSLLIVLLTSTPTQPKGQEPSSRGTLSRVSRTAT
jgi:hypothetical protein